MKDYSSALDDFNKYTSLVEDIKDPNFYHDKGWCENELGEYEDAVASLKKCVSLDDKYSYAYSELGYAYSKIYDNAIASYRSAIDLTKEKTAAPILRLADMYYDNVMNYDSTTVYFKKYVQLDQTDEAVYYKLGWYFNDKKKYDEAIPYLKISIALDPGFIGGINEQGFSYYQLKK